METKKCFNCGEEKPLEEFPKKKTSKDGYHPRCQVCLRAYVRDYNKRKKAGEIQPRKSAKQLTPEEVEIRRIKEREYSRKYYEENKEKVIARRNEVLKKNPDKKRFSNIEKALGKKSKVWRPGM